MSSPPDSRPPAGSLRDLQRRMMESLLGRSDDDARVRLRVYRNTIRSNFLESLRSSYPVVLRLVGEAYFRQTVHGFQQRVPSRSGDLQLAGAAFADHLGALHAGDAYAYLADVARLEWSIQESLLAADHAPLDLAKLARVDAATYDELHFALHPTVRLFRSAYPAHRIWAENLRTDAEPALIDLDSGSDRVALMRSNFELQFLPLSPGEFAFLDALQADHPFLPAVEKATALDAGFDAATALQRFVAATVIVDFR